ncbi:MAG: hypothetical protein ACOYKD_10270 [Anaerolineaceae bacterium]|jgi:hypothetical protein
MANFVKLADPRGTKLAWHLLSSILNIAWALAWFSIVDWMIARSNNTLTGIDTTLMLGIFLGTVGIGILVALMANDGRGLTYGLYGGLVGLVVIAIMTWKSGLLAGLVGLMAVFGNYNGSSLGEMIRNIRKRKR